MEPLETPRLALCPFRHQDAEGLLAVFADAEVMRFSEQGVQGRGWVEGWIQGRLEHYQQHGFGKLAVLEKPSLTVIGYCGLEIETLDGRKEVALGYRLARGVWGLGYATEAARRVVEHGLDQLQLPRLVAAIDPNNLASVRVAEKLGMRHEKAIMLEGYTHPDHLYVISR